MLSALKKILGTRTSKNSERPTEASLFSGSAYFSNRVPKVFIEKWMAHGGEVSSGTTLDARARYFFGTEPSEPWVTKLFAKSVMVIHAGWIVHCVDEAFQVPITQYILDDRFVPGLPYKVTNITPSMYVPLSEPDRPTDTESGESGGAAIQASDTPSTPTNMRRKRKREQAYFDSPSGSFIYSGFDKDGLPRRPRKLRRFQLNPSLSPVGRGSSIGAEQGMGLDWFRDHHDASRDDDELREKHGQDTGAGTLRSLNYMATVRSPDTPDKPLAYERQSAIYRCLSSDGHLSKPTHVSSPAISIDRQAKIPPIRTIDFANLPPPTRRWRFPQADAPTTGDTGTVLSVVKPTDYRVKTPKKISFAEHARVCVYMVSPRRADAANGADAGPARRCLDEGFKDRPKVDGNTRVSNDDIERPDDSTAKGIKCLTLQTNSPKVNNDPSRLLDGDPFENDTLTLKMEDVQAMRRRLLDSAGQDVDNDHLATSFELGKTFCGMTFRHVW